MSTPESTRGIDQVAGFLRFTGRVLRGAMTVSSVRGIVGESLRQAGVLITGSVLVVFALVFALGLQCGIEGAYGARAVGAPSVTGAFTALCTLREVVPFAFGYMMAAKVGTGLVAELGAMRISEEIDALGVMGIDAIVFLCASRLLGTWLVLPFVYAGALSVGYFGSYLAVVEQIGETSGGGYFQVFWQFQSPLDVVYSAVKGMAMATFVVLVGLYYGYHATGGPVGVGRATARSMVVNILGVHVIGMIGTQAFWGGNPRAPIGG
jgi:phospholipid/cholesterol/gamma-HCH transport system permease protein